MSSGKVEAQCLPPGGPAPGKLDPAHQPLPPFPRTLFPSYLLSTTIDLSLLQNYGNGEKTTLLASLLPSSIALFFCSSSQTNFLESVYTSCLYFLTFRLLSNPFQPGFHSPNSTEMAFVKSLAPSLLPSPLNTFLSSPPSTSQKHSTQLAVAPFWKHSAFLGSMSIHPSFPYCVSGCSFLVSFACPSLSPRSLKFLRTQSVSGWHHSCDCK